jgi:hypothetical protein
MKNGGLKKKLNDFLKKIPFSQKVQAFAPHYEKAKNFFGDMFEPLFATEWGRRASWGALGLFALLLLIVIIQTLGTWYDDVRISRMSMHSSRAVTDNMSQWIMQIPDEHLFGKLGVTDQGAIPITSLQLRLVGVIKSDPENFSRVIISESGQLPKVYGIGDSLPSGISINAITADGVILENGGHLEKLPLQRPPLVFQGMPQPLLDQER